MDDHRRLVNMFTEGINESLHDLGGIEEIPCKNGFSQEHKNFVSKELVNPSRFVLSKE